MFVKLFHSQNWCHLSVLKTWYLFKQFFCHSVFFLLGFVLHSIPLLCLMCLLCSCLVFVIFLRASIWILWFVFQFTNLLFWSLMHLLKSNLHLLHFSFYNFHLILLLIQLSGKICYFKNIFIIVFENCI